MGFSRGVNSDDYALRNHALNPLDMGNLKERKFYPKFKATAKNGRLILDDELTFSKYLINFDERELSVVVKLFHKERIRQEEKYYHAVVVRMIADEMAIPDQEAHEMLREMFLREETKTESGLRYGP